MRAERCAPDGPAARAQDPNFRSQHEEVELLFESYLNAFSSLQAALETVEYSIDSSERFVAQRLSSQRNGLLRMDVTFTVITAAISLCSFVTGMFGMNLSSGLEEQVRPRRRASSASRRAPALRLAARATRACARPRPAAHVRPAAPRTPPRASWSRGSSSSSRSSPGR